MHTTTSITPDRASTTSTLQSQSTATILQDYSAAPLAKSTDTSAATGINTVSIHERSIITTTTTTTTLKTTPQYIPLDDTDVQDILNNRTNEKLAHVSDNNLRLSLDLGTLLPNYIPVDMETVAQEIDNRSQEKYRYAMDSELSTSGSYINREYEKSIKQCDELRELDTKNDDNSRILKKIMNQVRENQHLSSILKTFLSNPNNSYCDTIAHISILDISDHSTIILDIIATYQYQLKSLSSISIQKLFLNSKQFPVIENIKSFSCTELYGTLDLSMFKKLTHITFDTYSPIQTLFPQSIEKITINDMVPNSRIPIEITLDKYNFPNLRELTIGSLKGNLCLRNLPYLETIHVFHREGGEKGKMSFSNEAYLPNLKVIYIGPHTFPITFDHIELPSLKTLVCPPEFELDPAIQKIRRKIIENNSEF